MKKAALSITNLLIHRNDHFRVHIPRLTLLPGTLLAIVGANGSGKSTLIETITGLLEPTQGRVSYHGVPINQNLRQWKAQLGYIPDDESWLIEELCAREYIQLLIQVYRDTGVASDMSTEATRLASLLQFTQWEQPLGSLSHGNKKKIQIIAGLLHQPPFLIIDELRNGLDPLAIIQAEKLITEAKERGTCIVAATHDIWWADRVADEIMFLSDGNPILHQTPAAIRKTYGSIELALTAVTQNTRSDT